jgi:hypothetical protein
MASALLWLIIMRPTSLLDPNDVKVFSIVSLDVSAGNAKNLHVELPRDMPCSAPRTCIDYQKVISRGVPLANTSKQKARNCVLQIENQMPAFANETAGSEANSRRTSSAITQTILLSSVAMVDESNQSATITKLGCEHSEGCNTTTTHEGKGQMTETTTLIRCMRTCGNFPAASNHHGFYNNRPLPTAVLPFSLLSNNTAGGTHADMHKNAVSLQD